MTIEGTFEMAGFGKQSFGLIKLSDEHNQPRTVLRDLSEEEIAPYAAGVEAKARQSWTEATRNIATELLSGAEPETVFRLLAEEALKLTDAEAALVAVPVAEDTSAADMAELLVIEAVGGEVAGTAGQTIPVANTPVEDAFTMRAPRRVERIELDGVDSGGPALILPLRVGDAIAGVVVVVRHNRSAPFSDEQLDMMAAFTDQAALAWQLATSQRRMREFDVLTERDRIARDLHDHVIQRLSAVGLTLQGTIPRARNLEVRQRLSDAVDDLQAVISEIWTTIFDLHSTSYGGTRLRQRLDDAVTQFPGFELHTTVQYIGPLSVVDPVLADHAEAVVREAVSNTIRHA